MRKLFVIALLALLSTGCAYKGSCETDATGQHYRPYNDDSHYSQVTCTEYCSHRVPGLCRSTASEMLAAVEDKQIEQDKARCSRYGIADKTEAMTNCVMEKSAARVTAAKVEAEQQQQMRMQAMQASQQESINTQQFIQRQQQRNNELSNNLRESSNQQMQQTQQRRYQPEPTKSTDFACMSNCQNAGYSFGLCQSKCSY